MFKDIMTLKVYTKDGVEKKAWQKVGVLKEFNGKQYIDLYMFPETSFFIFDNQPADTNNSDYPKDELSNISF